MEVNDKEGATSTLFQHIQIIDVCIFFTPSPLRPRVEAESSREAGSFERSRVLREEAKSSPLGRFDYLSVYLESSKSCTL